MTLSEDELAALHGTLPAWTVKDGALHRTLKFPDFSAAWGFMCRVALLAERMDHHPDWSNGYGTVTIALSTHDQGGVTQKDVALAGLIDRLL